MSHTELPLPGGPGGLSHAESTGRAWPIPRSLEDPGALENSAQESYGYLQEIEPFRQATLERLRVQMFANQEKIEK